jgi:hypothetical protein
MGALSLANAKIPAHVPAELIWDHSFDAFTAEGNDPYLAVTRLHEGPGIIWATDAGVQAGFSRATI